MIVQGGIVLIPTIEHSKNQNKYIATAVEAGLHKYYLPAIEITLITDVKIPLRFCNDIKKAIFFWYNYKMCEVFVDTILW